MTGLLNNLATQTAPAIPRRPARPTAAAETQARERLEQALRIARLVQQTLCPQSSEIEGWQIAAHYVLARSVGGDFYDVVQSSDGSYGLGNL